MKRIVFSLMAVLIAVMILCLNSMTLKNREALGTYHIRSGAVNALIGDISFVEKYGRLPDADDDENMRIITHLGYIEHQLRQANANHLNASQKAKRLRNLEFLHEYRINGVFPKNYSYVNQRKPCFIDRDGAICAVGFLVEKSAGRGLAEAINAEFQYSKIMDIESQELESWVAESGLSKTELAMIQPAYEFRNEEDKIPKELELTVIGLAGSSAILNGIYASKREKHVLFGTLGVVFGATSFITGLSDKSNYPLPALLAGASSIVAGGWNLIFGKSKDSNKQKSIQKTPEIGLGIIPLKKSYGLGLRVNWSF